MSEESKSSDTSKGADQVAGDDESEFLNELEMEMRDRYTRNDMEYLKYLENQKTGQTPPIVEYKKILFDQNQPHEPNPKRVHDKDDEPRDKRQTVETHADYQ
jgi:hypothetical protein